MTGVTEVKHLYSFKTFTIKWVKSEATKMSFMVPSVEYLGHQIGANGGHTTSQKVEAILQAPDPQNPQQLWSILSWTTALLR